MNGIDILAVLLVVFLTAAHLRQRAINRHDRERDESRKAVHNILRATGQLQ